ncbi:MAG: Inner membrane transport protein YdhP [Promethearchaeota archaeon]|nr:MAG: Inner membrane transport protein YdhP [Candidatus Lokiarchaeota archaeon]
MLIPAYGAIKIELGVPEELLAIPDALFLLVSALFALIWGYYTDRINRTKLILAGGFSWTIGMLLTGSSLNLTTIIISRIISGVGLGCVLPIGYSILSDAIPPEERSAWFGWIAILSSASNAIGQGLSSFLGPIFSWRFPFFLMSGISIVVVFLIFFIKLPSRGAKEEELTELSELNLEYSYRISKDDLKDILNKKTNLYLTIQGFFAIIPGTVLIYFLTSMLSLYYFNELPQEIRLQTSTIFAGMVGVGYILGNIFLSYLGDVLFKRNKKNRTKLATICMFLTIPFCFLTMISIEPINSTNLNISYPLLIPTQQIWTYILLTIIDIFQVYPGYIYFFVAALIASTLSSGPVANKRAIMIDVNLPEHKGTATSLFNLSEQVGKGLTLLLSSFLISLLGSIFNMILFSILFWIPAGILWFLSIKTVSEDMLEKSYVLMERKQTTLIDYVFELEIQMDRAIQKIQDSKYYFFEDQGKVFSLLDDAITILVHCEEKGEKKSVTNVETNARRLKDHTIAIRSGLKEIYKELKQKKISSAEKLRLEDDLEQIKLQIAELDKSTFGTIQTYYESAYYLIVDAGLLRKYDLLGSIRKVYKAIEIYHRIKQLLGERTEDIGIRTDLSEEDSIAYEREKKLFKKAQNALWACITLKNQMEDIIKKLDESGVSNNDLQKISNLTHEYKINLEEILLDTFGDKSTRKKLLDLLEQLDLVFDEFYKLYELEKLAVF